MDTYICLYFWLKLILFYLVFLQIIFIADYLLNVRNYEFEMDKGYYCMWRGAYGSINIQSSVLCL